MDSTAYNIFKELQFKELVSPDSFMGASLPFSDSHKVGVSKGNEPMFFISCSENGNPIDINLEVFSVLFNRPCKIYENGICSEEVYTVIQLKTDNGDLQRYFINVVCLVLQQLPPIPTQKGLRVEIDKIIELFRSITNPPKQTLQGLWAELLVIEQSKNPEMLVKAWHSSPEDKFDFNDGKDKLEIKSTAKNHRVHSLSIDQLSPNAGSQLIIVSIFVVQTGVGKSIIDLQNTILSKISDIDLQLRLNTLILKTIGTDFDKISDVYFDYQLAMDSLECYNYVDIPTIEKTHIPDKVTNVHFDADLTLATPLSESENRIVDCELLNALLK